MTTPDRLRFIGQSDLEATWIAYVEEFAAAHGMAEWTPELRERLRRMSMVIAEGSPL